MSVVIFCSYFPVTVIRHEAYTGQSGIGYQVPVEVQIAVERCYASRPAFRVDPVSSYRWQAHVLLI